jgi:2-dehydro-3-deoxyphosphogluconate aldolase/(4S)-4-hydroxy-2-oxoglutarate aldolase
MSAVGRLRGSPEIERVKRERVLAILRKVEPARVDGLVEELSSAGVGMVEITLDSEGAASAIERLRETRPQLLVAAGTVRTASDVDTAVAAGAQLCVAPGTNREMIERCLELSVPVVPGALTPSEIEAAWALGASLVKLFPGRVVGPDYVRDVREPIGDVPLLVTGGVDASNARAFLDAGAVAVGAGSSLTRAGDAADAARALLTAVAAAA